MADYLSAILVCLNPVNLILIIAMVSLGIVFGAIPGLSATLGIALLLPITFGLSTTTSFVLLLAIWIGGVSGTFISAVAFPFIPVLFHNNHTIGTMAVMALVVCSMMIH